MSSKLNKAELVAALTAAGVTNISPSATVSQLRSMYDAEGISSSASNNNPPANEGAENNNNSAGDDGDNYAEIVASLEKKRKVLQLQKEVKALESELAEGVQALSITDVDNIVPKFSGDDAYSIEKWLCDFENAKFTVV